MPAISAVRICSQAACYSKPMSSPRLPVGGLWAPVIEEWVQVGHLALGPAVGSSPLVIYCGFSAKAQNLFNWIRLAKLKSVWSQYKLFSSVSRPPHTGACYVCMWGAMMGCFEGFS